ncbi:PH domain-like protein [Xylaria sp. CBS 124048]|nr:PH domain-like protein [Xylaria sp. CBS 124048]
MSRPESIEIQEFQNLSDPRNRHNHYQNSINNSHDPQRSGHSHGHAHRRIPSHLHASPRQHQIQLPASDYESDNVQDQPSSIAMPPTDVPERSNTDLNLTVLRRYLPGITKILSIAANAVVYTFQHPSQWKKTTTEGTMFICSQRKSAQGGECGCLFILNRKGLRNVILDLDNVSDFELSGELLIFKLDYAANEVQLESGEPVTPNVLGLWTYAEENSDRETNAALVYDMWSQVRDARAQTQNSDPPTLAAATQRGAPRQLAGRRLSVTDLFLAHNGNSMSARAP